MTLKPLGDRVLVKPAPKEEKTATGLYISSGAQEKPQRGEVIAVGAGKVNDHGERIALDVKVGDQVEAIVVHVNDGEGVVRLSKKRLEAGKAWEEIEAAVESKGA